MLSDEINNIRHFLEDRLNTKQEIYLGCGDSIYLVDTLKEVHARLVEFERITVIPENQRNTTPTQSNIVSLHDIRKAKGR